MPLHVMTALQRLKVLSSFECLEAEPVHCCRYEGEFAYGFAHGLGMHTTAKGEIYRGEYLLGKRHG